MLPNAPNERGIRRPTDDELAAAINQAAADLASIAVSPQEAAARLERQMDDLTAPAVQGFIGSILHAVLAFADLHRSR